MFKTLFETKKKHRKSRKISDRHKNCHKKVSFRRRRRERRKRVKISRTRLFSE